MPDDRWPPGPVIVDGRGNVLWKYDEDNPALPPSHLWNPEIAAEMRQRQEARKRRRGWR